ncbi:MAG: TnpV protein [Christensenellales bacterium]
MNFEEMLEKYRTENTEENRFQKMFGDLSSQEEITEKMVELTEQEIQKDSSMMSHRFATARLKYMAEEKPEELQEMFLKESLLTHLLEVEKEARRFMEMEKPKMMKSMGVTEELKAKDQMKWVGLMENLKHTLMEMAMKEYVYI